MTFFYAPEFFYLTVVYFLLIYASLTIFTENLFLLHPLIARLSTETAAFLLFGFFVASLFVSGCIQTFTSASRRCRFHCRQLLRHSLLPVTAFSFSHFCFSRRRLAIQSFISPSCHRCRLLSLFIVRRRPLIRSLQLVVSLPLVFTSASHSQCRFVVFLRVPQESYKSSYRPARFLKQTSCCCAHCNEVVTRPS